MLRCSLAILCSIFLYMSIMKFASLFGFLPFTKSVCIFFTAMLVPYCIHPLLIFPDFIAFIVSTIFSLFIFSICIFFTCWYIFYSFRILNCVLRCPSLAIIFHFISSPFFEFPFFHAGFFSLISLWNALRFLF